MHHVPWIHLHAQSSWFDYVWFVIELHLKKNVVIFDLILHDTSSFNQCSIQFCTSILFNPFLLCPINPGVFDLFWIFSGVQSRSASPRTARPSVPSPSPAMPSPGRSAMPSPIRPDSPDPAMMLQAPCFDTKTSCFFSVCFFRGVCFFVEDCKSVKCSCTRLEVFWWLHLRMTIEKSQRFQPFSKQSMLFDCCLMKCIF